jgi:hypothetical protein
MVAALSLDGYEAVHVVPGSVDGEEFLDYIVNEVVCCMFYIWKNPVVKFGFICQNLAKFAKYSSFARFGDLFKFGRSILKFPQIMHIFSDIWKSRKMFPIFFLKMSYIPQLCY